MATNESELYKRNILIGYFLSRCDQKALQALGYRGFSEAFQELGKIIGENPNNIRNIRDEFDPLFDNPRKGWHQRDLSPSRQFVFDQFEDMSDDELTFFVKDLLSEMNNRKDNNDILLELGTLIRQTTVHFNEEFVWQEVELTEEFKRSYNTYLEKNKWEIEFYNATAVITTPTTKKIFVPNQWFSIAAYGVKVFNELHRYKHFFEDVADLRGERRDTYAKKLRDDASVKEKDQFMESAKIIFENKFGEGQEIKTAVKRLWRFVSDYSWWSGQKTIDRGDFYVSVVLNMFNLVNVSQGYVADIVNAYGSDYHLEQLTKTLDSFTTNLDGTTYDFVLEAEEEQGADKIAEEPVPYGEKKIHKIKISAESIKKIGGK
ncbi:hypothetical protein M2145_001043 [Lachnospiraceae bacterium PF1-21]|uniref:hypothetical protein n=1 Tax=Ohessyouella blattaphilus TaxID=2949333 RepID=UPI003E2B0565